MECPVCFRLSAISPLRDALSGGPATPYRTRVRDSEMGSSQLVGAVVGDVVGARRGVLSFFDTEVFKEQRSRSTASRLRRLYHLLSISSHFTCLMVSLCLCKAYAEVRSEEGGVKSSTALTSPYKVE